MWLMGSDGDGVYREGAKCGLKLKNTKKSNIYLT
jgi:hypothetical protein